MCALKRVHMPCVARLAKVGLADRSAVSSSHGLSNRRARHTRRMIITIPSPRECW